MEEIKLKLGECKISSLAEWFGISKNYLSHCKKQKLEELKNFCDYEIISNTKINITNIKISVYNKKSFENYSIIKEEVPKKWNYKGLDCCSRVSNIIYEEKDVNKITLSENSTYEYVRKAKNELYGKCGSYIEGILGKSKYVWGKKNIDGTYSYLSIEEEQKKKELLDKYFKNTTEASLFIQESVQRGEITKQEAWEKYTELTNMKINFAEFLKEFKKLTGVQLIRCTEVELRDYIANNKK